MTSSWSQCVISSRRFSFAAIARARSMDTTSHVFLSRDVSLSRDENSLNVHAVIHYMGFQRVLVVTCGILQGGLDYRLYRIEWSTYMYAFLSSYHLTSQKVPRGVNDTNLEILNRINPVMVSNCYWFIEPCEMTWGVIVCKVKGFEQIYELTLHSLAHHWPTLVFQFKWKCSNLLLPVIDITGSKRLKINID